MSLEAWDDEGDVADACQHCEGEGRLLVCKDAACQLADFREECQHEDGYLLCAKCKGSGLAE